MRRKVGSHVRSRRFLVIFFSIILLFTALEQTVWAAGQPEFVATQIYEANSPVFGLAWGDFDPCNIGMEVACLLQYGSVLELAPDVPNWQPTLINDGNTEGFSTGPAIGIGDVHSGYSGNEIITHAGAGSAKITVVFFAPATGWSHKVLFDNTGLMGTSWDARVGDYDPCHPGDEIFHIYEAPLDESSGTVFREDGGIWHTEEIYRAEVGCVSAAGDFNPDHQGPEIVLTTEIIRIYEILAPNNPDSKDWPIRDIWDGNTYDVGCVVEIADVDPCHTGNEIVYGTVGNRIMISRHNGEGPHEFQILFTGDANEYGYTQMLDIAVGDVLPQMAGLEILGVDYTGSVYLVRRVEDTWQGQVIWKDVDSLYAVIVGDFLPARAGDEILVAGESGTITLLTLTFPDSLTGDGRVNFQDFAELANYWQQSEPSADIGPWPIGDGAVDFLDVAVLADNWLETAYWTETDIGPCLVGDGAVDFLDVAVLADNWLETTNWTE